MGKELQHGRKNKYLHCSIKKTNIPLVFPPLFNLWRLSSPKATREIAVLVPRPCLVGNRRCPFIAPWCGRPARCCGILLGLAIGQFACVNQVRGRIGRVGSLHSAISFWLWFVCYYQVLILAETPYSAQETMFSSQYTHPQLQAIFTLDLVEYPKS